MQTSNPLRSSWGLLVHLARGGRKIEGGEERGRKREKGEEKEEKGGRKGERMTTQLLLYHFMSVVGRFGHAYVLDVH